jgi:N-acylglucosamine 2-epimerase
MTAWSEFAAQYGVASRRALVEDIVPFWSRTLDEARGGVFNCWNNAGTQLVSRDKFTWSQGRFAWLWSRLAELAGRGLIAADSRAFLRHAEKTVHFLQEHALLADGRCAFLLVETGEPKEAFAGAGPAPSIYADCFAMMGFAEYARVRGEVAWLDAAWRLFESIDRRIGLGTAPTFPQPTPAGYEAHGLAMIYLNLTHVLREACEAQEDQRQGLARQRNLAAAARIFDDFLQPDGRIAEMRPHATGDAESLLSRHVNPGHSLEGLWMLLSVAAREGREDWMTRALAAVRFAVHVGWDAEYGGLLLCVDREGGQPKGAAGDSPYEANVRATWDTKLWWVHSEALYTTALAYRLSGDASFRQWFERIWEYAFRVFPQPDRRVGEWIQIRDRAGEPLERVVALPVKDPYHIARNLCQLIELFAAEPA